MKKIALLIVFILSSIPIHAQSISEFTLKEAYTFIEKEYPVVEKIDIQKKIADFNVSIRQSGLYPNIIFSASTSYQSDVTQVPFAAPGTTPPSFSKDHYNFTVDISQPLFDGGKTKSLKNVERSKEKVGLAGIDVELQKIRAQVDQVFFGIILLKEKKDSIELLIQDIKNQLILVKSKVKNGVLLKGNELTLRAELLKVKQQQIEVFRSISSGYKILGEIVNRDLSSEPKLAVNIDISSFDSDLSNHAEYKLLKTRKEVLESRKELFETDRLPVLSAFAKTAYGRPGLNAFDDDLQLFWIIGLKARWDFRSWRNSTKQIEVLTLHQNTIEVEEDAFTRQLKSSIIETRNRIDVLKNQIELDKEVMELREQIVQESKALLNQGVITSTEWLNELNEKYRARLNFEVHQVQLSQAWIEYQTKNGMSWK